MTNLETPVSKTVYVLGAGFTKAFLPDAPLLRDYYDIEQLAEKFERFPYSSRLIDLERNRFRDGRIDIERLLTRLDSKMPYDFERGVTTELSLLRTAVLDMFNDRLNTAKQGFQHRDDLLAFARHCVCARITCITFNYDDLLDQALWEVAGTDVVSESPYWHPDGGYGFYCRPSRFLVEDSEGRVMDTTSMELLKLHGSINWRVRRGHLAPYTVDTIVHHEDWLPLEEQPGQPGNAAIEDHLQPEPFMVPPVLAKTDHWDQPILRLVWNKALIALREAREVVFVGYSFPATDFAADVLFREALAEAPDHPSPANIRVVNLASRGAERRDLLTTYQSRLGPIPEERFDFRGALEWSREVTHSG